MVRVTGVDALTIPAVIENVAELTPCGTVTDEGTLAAAPFELESETTAPPLPAADVRVTVPVVDWPLSIVFELREILLRAATGGFTVRPDAILAPE